MTQFLYHGTSSACMPDILRDGIVPRKMHKRPGHWSETPSNPHNVYLTRAYAPYFAMSAAMSYGGRPVVLEIHLGVLPGSRMRADEDALEQVSREFSAGNPLYCPVKGMLQRTMWFRKRLDALSRKYPEIWRASLQILGTCSHKGVIPPRAIVAERSFKNPSEVIMEWGDPMIHILNYRVLGARYRIKTDQMFGRQPDDSDVASPLANLPGEKDA